MYVVDQLSYVCTICAVVKWGRGTAAALRASGDVRHRCFSTASESAAAFLCMRKNPESMWATRLVPRLGLLPCLADYRIAVFPGRGAIVSALGCVGAVFRLGCAPVGKSKYA